LIHIKAHGARAAYHRRMRAKSIFAVPATLSADERQQRRHALVRLSLAWLAMMQVMMFAWPGYLRHEGIPKDALDTLDWAIVLMNWASLALTVPVVLYSAWPIWRHAGANLRQGRAGMDVPVALGIVAAFIPSVHATYTGRGEVYFDSVTMFVAFLLTARYLELCARQSFGGAAGGLRHARVEAQRLALGAGADRLASRFVLAQVALALGAGAVWAYIDPAHSVPVMVALLVMSCPCAMSMAVPTAMASAHAALAADPAMSDAALDALLERARRKARQNLHGSLAWHLLMTPLALVGWVTPWLAAITMLVSSLAVAYNSWRLTRHHGLAGEAAGGALEAAP
jgi:cation transport ATPase